MNALGRPPAAGGSVRVDVIYPRVRAVMAAARFHGMELDPAEILGRPGEAAPRAAELAAWARTAGLWAKAARLRWRQLFRFDGAAPVVLLFTDGGAGLLVGANPERNVVFIADPTRGGDARSPPTSCDCSRSGPAKRCSCVLSAANPRRTRLSPWHGSPSSSCRRRHCSAKSGLLP